MANQAKPSNSTKPAKKAEEVSKEAGEAVDKISEGLGRPARWRQEEAGKARVNNRP